MDCSLPREPEGYPGHCPVSTTCIRHCCSVTWCHPDWDNRKRAGILVPSGVIHLSPVRDSVRSEVDGNVAGDVRLLDCGRIVRGGRFFGSCKDPRAAECC